MIKILCVGSIKEAALKQLLFEYEKRLNKPYQIEWIEIEESKKIKNPSQKQVMEMVNEESATLITKIADNDYLILCDVSGKQLTSKQLSEQIQRHFTYNNSSIVFVIGGSNGVNETLKKRADSRLSFSLMTFPHQLFRLMLIEQIYRCYTINNNITYHK